MEMSLFAKPRKVRAKRVGKITTPAVVGALKGSGQDFEWYPTTDEMITAVVRHIGKRDRFGRPGEKPNLSSVLDIGAGDGRVLTALAEACSVSDLYAIEKAAPLLENMPANIAVVGTDFHYQTLIDKDVDVIFCNPPYSEYEDWAVKIIKEGLCNDAYLILPQRWAESPRIKLALESRSLKAKTIWHGDFTHAERQARAVVDIVHVSMRQEGNDRYRRDEKKDPFETWFHETFPQVEVIDTLKDETAPDKISNDLLTGCNLVDRLAELYQEEMKKMHASYRALCQIDPALLKTVGVEVAEVKKGLRQKIAGMKNLYWQELFNHLDKINKRLTCASREVILKKMASAVHVDFTAENAYAVVLWVLKNANLYINSQLVDLFKKLSGPENIRNYKSNQKTWDRNGWRYNSYYNREPPHTHYMLEYRIITQQHLGIKRTSKKREYISDNDYPNGLYRDCHDTLNDIITVANNLGFSCYDSSMGHGWDSGSPELFYLSGSEEILMRAKAFCNGNLHIQFHQGFIKALNVEASRLLGWIKSPREACEEMDIDFETAEKHFNTNRIFAPSECKLLTAGEGGPHANCS